MGTLVALAVIATGIWLLGSGFLGDGIRRAASPAVMEFCRVSRSDLPISITETGVLESQSNELVCCNVGDVPDDGVDGTAILWIVPNGSQVRAGDLLVELDSSHHRERLDRQLLVTEQARVDQLQAKTAYEAAIQVSSEVSEAELHLKLVEAKYQAHKDTDHGMLAKEADELEREVESLTNAVLVARAELEIARADCALLNKAASEGANAEPVRPKGKEAAGLRVGYLKAEAKVGKAMNDLETASERLARKTSYENSRKLLDLALECAHARRDLERAQRERRATLTQARGDLEAANECMQKHEELLSRYRAEVESCRIQAPAGGFVVHYRAKGSGVSAIRPGYLARRREPILSLPDLKRMQVETSVRQADYSRVKEGACVTVRLDAFPDRSYPGSVRSVASLPSRGPASGAGASAFRVVAAIEEEVEGLVPGMAAVVEVTAEPLHDVLSVPGEAIIEAPNGSWCYVKTASGVERREVKPGMRSGDRVEIREGLSEGDQVAVNPDAVEI
jgi:HlyD family secretion protein